MPRNSLVPLLLAIAASFTLAPAYAIDSQFDVAQAAPAAAAEGPAHRRGPAAGRPELFTPAERDQFRDKMKSAKSPEERAAIRQEMRTAMEQRAKEKGVTLPPARMGQSGPGPMARLFTQEERDAFRDKLRNAKDRDERRKLMQEMHATAQTRAKEKGIEMPQRGPRGHRHPQEPRKEGESGQHLHG